MLAPQRAFPFLLTTFMISGSGALAARDLHNVEYSRPNGISLSFDASLPESDRPTAAVVIVHGGAWVAGDKRQNVQPLFKPLADAGFAWFSISYRLANNPIQFGAGVEDVREAVRFIKAHSAEYNIDPDRIALLGESAGGQLAAMAAIRGSAESSVRAVVAMYTPTDLVTLAKTSTFIPDNVRDSVRGGPFENILMAGLAQLSPLNNVRKDMPPFLFIHGTSDSLVPFEQSTDMCDRMKAAGASCEVYAVKGGGHGLRWWESQPGLASGYKVAMVRWLKGQLNERAIASRR